MRTRTSEDTVFSLHRASNDADVQDEDRDGDEDIRGRQITINVGTSEDEDGEDVDVLRRPDHKIINHSKLG